MLNNLLIGVITAKLFVVYMVISRVLQSTCFFRKITKAYNKGIGESNRKGMRRLHHLGAVHKRHIEFMRGMMKIYFPLWFVLLIVEGIIIAMK